MELTSVIGYITVGTLFLAAVIHLLAHNFLAGTESKYEREHRRFQKASSKLNDFIEMMQTPEKQSELEEYRDLPNETARLRWLSDMHPEAFAHLENISGDEVSSHSLDRAFYKDGSLSFMLARNDLETHPTVRAYKLGHGGVGFPEMSINQANVLISQEDESFEQRRALGLAMKEKAVAFWHALPKKTRKAIKNASTSEERNHLFLDSPDAENFSAYYPIIDSMYLTNVSETYSTHSPGVTPIHPPSSSSRNSDAGSHDDGSFSESGSEA